METRTSKTIINSFLGLCNKMINIFSPFLIRTAIIYSLSIEYVGLNSLFSSILQILNLAELGISSAVVYCMYKPMAEQDVDLINAILNYMKKIYYIIGVIVASIGLILIPVVPHLINGSIPNDLNVIILYLIYLLNTVLSYFFYAYRATLFNADQKAGVLSYINTYIILIQSIVQIIILIFLKNYYLYLCVLPIFTIINNFWIKIATDKQYPYINKNSKLSLKDKENIKVRVKGLFLTRICTATRNAFDSIFISAFIGLRCVAIYGNYYYIITAIITLLSVITTAMTASVGNSMVIESVKKNYLDMRKFNFMYNWIVGFCTASLLVLYQPFMTIWVGKSNLFHNEMVILMCVYFYFLNIGSIRAVYHDAAGLWWEARYRAIFESVLNLILNFILTYHYGVFGTVLGTLISLFVVNYCYGTLIVFKYYFRGIGAKEYFKDNLIYGLVTLFICLVLYIINTFISINGIAGLTLRGILCLIVFNLLYFTFFHNHKLYKESKLLIQSIVKQMYLKDTKYNK